MSEKKCPTCGSEKYGSVDELVSRITPENIHAASSSPTTPEPTCKKCGGTANKPLPIPSRCGSPVACIEYFHSPTARESAVESPEQRLAKKITVRVDNSGLYNDLEKVLWKECLTLMEQVEQLTKERERLLEISRLTHEMAALVGKDDAFIVAWNKASDQLLSELRKFKDRAEAAEAKLREQAEAVEELLKKFEGSFHVRSDHKYSGNQIYEWLRTALERYERTKLIAQK